MHRLGVWAERAFAQLLCCSSDKADQELKLFFHHLTSSTTPTHTTTPTQPPNRLVSVCLWSGVQQLGIRTHYVQYFQHVRTHLCFKSRCLEQTPVCTPPHRICMQCVCCLWNLLCVQSEQTLRVYNSHLYISLYSDLHVCIAASDHDYIISMHFIKLYKVKGNDSVFFDWWFETTKIIISSSPKKTEKKSFFSSSTTFTLVEVRGCGSVLISMPCDVYLNTYLIWQQEVESGEFKAGNEKPGDTTGTQKAESAQSWRGQLDRVKPALWEAAGGGDFLRQLVIGQPCPAEPSARESTLGMHAELGGVVYLTLPKPAEPSTSSNLSETSAPCRLPSLNCHRGGREVCVVCALSLHVSAFVRGLMQTSMWEWI